MRALTGWTFAIALVIGCGKKTDTTAKTDPSTTTPVEKAAEAPPPPPPPAANEYDTHMKSGAALEDQKKWADAQAAFEAALAKKPDDVRALNEVAFTAGLAGKLDRAQEAAIAAAAAAKDDKKAHGQALFNLGLAVEKTQPYAAAQLYAASLTERPNRGVSARLAKLQKDKASSQQSKDALAILAKVGVTPSAKAAPPAEPPSSTPANKEDGALMSALEAAGVEWQSGAGKSVLFVENVDCTENHQSKKASYECTSPALKGDAAKALVGALTGKKIAPVKEHGDMATYHVTSIRCRTFNEGNSGAPDECEVTP